MPNEQYSIQNEIDLREIIAGLWAHKIVIAFIVGLSIFIAGYKALTDEKMYTAQAIFQLEQKSDPGFKFSQELSSIASLAGLRDSGANSTNLLERISGSEFILDVSKRIEFKEDPFFNTFNPNHKDPAWKATVKNLIGWQSTKAELSVYINNGIISSFRNYIKVSKTEGDAISIAVTHTQPKIAAEYANKIMHEIRNLIQFENDQAQKLRLSYLSETLADALQDVESAQKNLKKYALENSTLAQENFISGSLKLDELRGESRKVSEISNLLSVLENLIENDNLKDTSHDELRSTYPLIDDVGFRRILGMSETISAWSWPDINTVKAVRATLRDRSKRLDIEIQSIEDSAKMYASSAGDLAKFKRDAKIAEATYKVLIEQVKSQSLAAGFQADTFKVFEYASTPLAPSSPKRNRILMTGALLGLVIGCSLAIANIFRRGTYYTTSAIISAANPSLSLKYQPFKRLSKASIPRIENYFSKRRIMEIDEVEIKLKNRKLIYVIDCGGSPTTYGTSQILATQTAASGKKVIICDTTGQLQKQNEGKPTETTSKISTFNLASNISLMDGNIGPSFFTSSRFNSNIEQLLTTYNHIFICSGRKEAILGLMALKEFDPSILVLTRLRSTRKMDIKKILENKSIDILFHG